MHGHERILSMAPVASGRGISKMGRIWNLLTFSSPTIDPWLSSGSFVFSEAVEGFVFSVAVSVEGRVFSSAVEAVVAIVAVVLAVVALEAVAGVVSCGLGFPCVGFPA